MAVALKSRLPSGADRVYAICLVHLILCVVIIAMLTPGDESLQMGGVLVAPILQWWNSAFAALSISVIILAAVGVLYLIEWHLDIYAGLLVVSIAIDLCWFFAFLFYGSSCSSGDATVSCSFNSGAVIVAITAIVLFKIFALWAVLKAKRSVRIKYNEELLPYLRQSLSSSISDGALVGDEMAERAGKLGGEGGSFAFGGAAGLAGANFAGTGNAAAGSAGANFAGAGDAAGNFSCAASRAGNKSVSFASAPEVANIGGTGSCCGSPMATGGFSAGGYGATSAATSCYGSAGVPTVPVAISSDIAPTGTVGMLGPQVAVPTVAAVGASHSSGAGSMAPIPTVASQTPGAMTATMPMPGTVGTAGAEAIFEQIDKDHDGFITRAEFDAFRARSGQPAPGSSPTVGSSESSD